MMNQIELGKIRNMNKRVDLARNVINKHILITGMSGSGKTMALKTIEHAIVKNQGCVIVLNCGATHEWKNQDKNIVEHWSVKNQGFPFRLFEQIEDFDGKKESFEDIADDILIELNRINRMNSTQKKILYENILYSLKNEKSELCMQTIVRRLEEEQEEEAIDILNKISCFFRRIRITDQTLSLNSGKIFDIDFSGYTTSAQWCLAGITLSWIWRYSQLRGRDNRYDIYVAVDEFQNIDKGNNLVMEQILREGRRHKMFLLLATQTLAGNERCERVIFHQVGTKLCFKPTEEEYRQIAKMIDSEQVEEASYILSHLQVGECLAKGKFSVGGVIIEKPLKISFR